MILSFISYPFICYLHFTIMIYKYNLKFIQNMVKFISIIYKIKSARSASILIINGLYDYKAFAFWLKCL